MANLIGVVILVAPLFIFKMSNIDPGTLAKVPWYNTI